MRRLCLAVNRCLLVLLTGILFHGPVGALEWQDVGQFDKPMTFRNVASGGNCGGCSWISAVGVITSDTPEHFAKFLDQHPGAGTMAYGQIALHSPGGDLFAAIRLGRLIRKYGYFTTIGFTKFGKFGASWSPGTEAGTCASACAYAFLGGKRRFLVDGYGIGDRRSRIGFHQFNWQNSLASVPDTTLAALAISKAQFVTGLLIAYIVEMGADARVVFWAGSTVPTDMKFPSFEELSEFNVVTADGFSKWRMEPVAKGLVAVSRRTESEYLVSQVAAYCRTRDRKSMLLLTTLVSANMLPNQLRPDDWYIEMAFDGQVFKLPSTIIEFVRRKNNDLFKIALPDSISASLLNAKKFEATLGLPRVMGFHHVSMNLTELDQKSISLAFRNCADLD